MAVDIGHGTDCAQSTEQQQSINVRHCCVVCVCRLDERDCRPGCARDAAFSFFRGAVSAPATNHDRLAIDSRRREFFVSSFVKISPECVIDDINRSKSVFCSWIISSEISGAFLICRFFLSIQAGPTQTA